MATSSMPLTGARVGDAAATAAAIEALEEIEVVIPMRIDQAEVVLSERRQMDFTLVGSISGHGAWTVIDGADLIETDADGGPSTIVVNLNLASALSLSAGQTVTVRSECLGRRSILPTVEFEVVGIATFPFDPESQLTAAVTIADFDRACGGEQDQADLFLVASRSRVTAEAAVKAIQQLRPDLYVFSNDQLVDRFERVGFSYFRQISTVLATVTLTFAFLLISVLLSVSVNQRFAEIAALRAMGFGRRRVAADLVWESGLMVSIGGVLALPLGLALAIWLDRILKSMPGIPADLHFQPQASWSSRRRSCCTSRFWPPPAHWPRVTRSTWRPGCRSHPRSATRSSDEHAGGRSVRTHQDLPDAGRPPGDRTATGLAPGRSGVSTSP